MTSVSATTKVKGVCRKHYENVLARLLSKNLNPLFIPLPSPPQFQQADLDSLPAAARIQGKLRGQIDDPKKAQRKEDQVKSLIRCIFALFPNENQIQEIRQTIVDFGGGSGHLALLLALLCPKAKIIVVDLKQGSLDLLHAKAQRVRLEQDLEGLEPVLDRPSVAQVDEDLVKTGQNTLNATDIPNLFTFWGDIESYQYPFDIGVALHVCGQATDIVIHKCVQQNAHCVVAPCCVGKISSVNKDPYIFHAREARRNGTTAEDKNLDTVTNSISYPQSRRFLQCLECHGSIDVAKDWNSLASAADTTVDMNDRRNATKRTAKTLLEFDRKLFIDERYSYQTLLTRMDPLTASPKNDILIGFYKGEEGTTNPLLKSTATEDPAVVWTKQHLLHPGAASAVTKPSEVSPETKKVKTQGWKGHNGVDWTWEEEQEIRRILAEHFVIGAVGVELYVFPTGMGGRKRKLIHFVAEELGLVHISVGKKNAEKTVGVRRRYVKEEHS